MVEKKSQQVTVVSSSALEEAGYIFCDADELLKRKDLVKIVKPNDCNDFQMHHHMTERDDCMKKTDEPERMLVILMLNYIVHTLLSTYYLGLMMSWGLQVSFFSFL